MWHGETAAAEDLEEMNLVARAGESELIEE